LPAIRRALSRCVVVCRCGPQPAVSLAASAVDHLDIGRRDS
jgi:hypothetical protein